MDSIVELIFLAFAVICLCVVVCCWVFWVGGKILPLSFLLFFLLSLLFLLSPPPPLPSS